MTKENDEPIYPSFDEWIDANRDLLEDLIRSNNMDEMLRVAWLHGYAAGSMSLANILNKHKIV